MSATDLIDVREELLAKQKTVHSIFEQAKMSVDGRDAYDFTKVKDAGLEGDSPARLEQVQSMMKEVDDLQKRANEFASLTAAEEQIKRLGETLSNGKQRSSSTLIHPDAGGSGEPNGLGEMFVNSAEFKSFRVGEDKKSAAHVIDLVKDIGGGSMHRGVKTLMSTSAGWGPEAVRTGRLVEDAQRPIQLIDMIPGETTNQNAVVYMEETTFTNNAAEVAEGGTFGEAALALTERTSPVRKIAVWLPITDEQLEDVPYVQSYVNNRLGFMIRQRLDGQCDVGDGIAPNLEGISVRSGIQSQAKGADPTLDAIYKAKVKVQTVAYANPNVLVINSNDLQDVLLTRTSDGLYIMGNPASWTGPPSIWGLRTVETNSRTENTALVGDTTFTGLAMRRNVSLKITDSHGEYFINGKQAIRCDMRAALQVYRPEAFCKVTGI